MCKRVIGSFVAAAVLAAACFGAPAAQPDRQQLARELQELNNQAKPFTQLFQKVIDVVAPSVVSVTTVRTVKMSQQSPLDDFNPFGPFGPFGTPDRDGKTPRRNAPQPRDREFKSPGLGSGFVVDAKNGWVVTNNHVVADVKAEDVKVIFGDGREVVAEKVFADPRTDVAVIKIKPENLVEIAWAGPDEIQRGEWVIAIGSPMGFGSTFTAGIVSAPSTRNRILGGGRLRDLHANQDPYAIEDYIQTDAAINPGNSGGPLVNLSGKVIGINTLIVTPSMANAGLGFAVPVRLARPTVDTLIATGRVVRGHLGVQIASPADIDDQAAWDLFRLRNSDEVLNKFRLKKDDKGVIVVDVKPNGPADKAGLKQGDLILSVNKTPTPDTESLRGVVAKAAPNSSVDLLIMREGREKTLTAKLGEQPTGTEVAWADKGRDKSSGVSAEVGLTVQTLTPDIAEGLGLPQDLKGVIVVDVAADGPAGQAGIEANDVITRVGKQEVKSLAEFQDAMKKVPPQGVVFLLRRGGESKFVSVKPGEKK
jgi:serine protease Do